MSRMLHVDVAIIGSGFAGSILASILAKTGMRVALIDGARHPRFAIGESSTPIADSILRRLGSTYQLPPFEALSAWGSWQRDRSDIACGKKRGFSYFQHGDLQPFGETVLGERSLLVAASPSDEIADTHWYRPEVDTFFWQQAIDAGVDDWSGHKVVAVSKSSATDDADDRTKVVCRGEKEVTLDSAWVIDASGQSNVLAKLSGTRDQSSRLRTRTHSCFAHYRGVKKWRDAESMRLPGPADPFDPDDAAQHHLVADGWVWMLRFNNGLTSVGYTTSADRTLMQPDQVSSRYPTLQELMKDAAVVAPRGGPFHSGRLQRFFDPVVSSRQIMLPTAALTLDPLHSTGIAHALAGVERVCRIIMEKSRGAQRDDIEQYRNAMLEETRLLDTLVSTAYATMHDFERFTAACMLYFAGAIRCEERYQAGETPSHLWNADDPAFVDFADWACGRLLSGETNIQNEIREGLSPWNGAGLMNPHCFNRYAYTATKKVV